MNEKIPMNIRRRAFFIIIVCTMVALAVSSILGFYGMFNVKNLAEKTGDAIGDTAAYSSSKLLESKTKIGLLDVAKSRANYIELYLSKTEFGTHLLSAHMSFIMSHPQHFPPKVIFGPADGGKMNTAVVYAPGVNPNDPALQAEIDLAANIQMALISMNHIVEDALASTYVASKNGFIISADRIEDIQLYGYEEYYKPFDPRERPWYIAAKQKKKLIFTDLYGDVVSGEIGITCAEPYWDADRNFAGVVGIGYDVKNLDEIIHETKFGKTGFCFIIDHDGNVLFSPKSEGELAIKSADDPSLLESANPVLKETIRLMTEGDSDVHYTVVDGKICYVAFAPLEKIGMSLGVVIKKDEVIADATSNKQAITDTTDNFLNKMNDQLSFVLAALVITFWILVFVAIFAANKISDHFVKPIDELSEGVQKISLGDFDKKLEIHTGDEIEHLADCVNTMASDIKTYMEDLKKVTADKERIATELKVAENIQQSMLPHDFNFNRNEFEIFATMNAAKAVGGDFYDFYLLDENHLVITIADVSGKGIPAALFMANSKTILKNFAMSMKTPDDFAAVMTLANQQLCQNNDEMMFVTVFMGMLDLKTGKFILVNGGHNPPMIYNSEKESVRNFV